MEVIQYLEEIRNDMNDIRKEYKELHEILQKNQQMLIELLQTNNSHTKQIYNATIKDKSAEQQTKDFLLNVAANLVGSSIATPTLVNLK